MSSETVRPSKDRTNPFKHKPELLTDPVFLIGNGSSRKDYDLEKLRPYGTILGCNALYRDFSPDVLLAIDAKMLRELNKSKYCETNMCVLPSNRTVGVPGSLRWRSDRYNTTGCFTMHLISEVMKPKICYMLGMDSYEGNIFDGTENYSVSAVKTFTGIKQYYMKALQRKGNTKFINVNTVDAWPEECYQTGKYGFMSYQEFEKQIMG